MSSTTPVKPSPPSIEEVGDRLAWLCAVERLEAMEPELAARAYGLRPKFELNEPLSDDDVALFNRWQGRLCELSDSYGSTIAKFTALLGPNFSYDGFAADLAFVREHARFASSEGLAQLAGCWMPMTRSLTTTGGLRLTEIFSMSALAGARLELDGSDVDFDLGHGSDTVRLAYFIACEGGLLRKNGLAGIACVPLSLTADGGVAFGAWGFIDFRGGPRLRASERSDVQKTISQAIHARGLDHMKRYLRETGAVGDARRARARLCRINGYDPLDPEATQRRFGELNEILMQMGLRGDSALAAFNGLTSILAWEARKAEPANDRAAAA